MFLVWILTWILQGQHVDAAEKLWHWFGQHEILTVLMVLFLA